MITTGFEIALGIFLFLLALIILVYGLTALAGLVLWLWSWASERSWWAKVVVVLVILQIFGGILGILGVGK